MLTLVGFAVVTASVLSGFVLAGGAIQVLIQPTEILIIVGAATGFLITSTPFHHLKALVGAVVGLLKGSGPTRQSYLDALVLQYEIFVNARKHGFIALERDIAEPDQSPIITKYAHFLRRHHAVVFLTDALRLLVDGAVAPHDLDALLDREIETHHEEASKPATIMSKVGDTLPGLGIVAAVLGVIIAMGKIDGPAAIMGQKVAVALVGTLLGVLLAYGFVNPLALSLEMASEGDLNYLQCLKAGVVAFAKGSPPAIAIEFARRAITGNNRPSLTELEAAIQGVTPR